MVYINSRGEVVQEGQYTNFFWKFIMFFVVFFKSLVGMDTKSDKKNDDRSQRFGTGGGFFSGGGGGGGGNSYKGYKEPRPFGPRGMGTITTPPPPPPGSMCGAGGCG